MARLLNEWERREVMAISEALPKADPIWGQPANVYDSALGGYVVLSDRSGSFFITTNLANALPQWSAEHKAILTTMINEQNRLGVDFPQITERAIDSIVSRKPLTFSQKVDSFFKYLDDAGHRPGKAIFLNAPIWDEQNEELMKRIMRSIEAISEEELHGFMVALGSMNLVEFESGDRWMLTGPGFQRLEEQGQTLATSDQAFIAMWFSSETQAAYDNGIVPALMDLGYRALRIDKKEHANKIDDEIIAEIRRSRFLVADFTCGVVSEGDEAIGVPRGGVYYEAGFAQGLGIPVIWTVREDQLSLVHFDIRQFNQIVWKDPPELRKKLFDRVGAVIGEYAPGGVRL